MRLRPILRTRMLAANKSLLSVLRFESALWRASLLLACCFTIELGQAAAQAPDPVAAGFATEPVQVEFGSEPSLPEPSDKAWATPPVHRAANSATTQPDSDNWQPYSGTATSSAQKPVATNAADTIPAWARDDADLTTQHVLPRQNRSPALKTADTAFADNDTFNTSHANAARTQAVPSTATSADLNFLPPVDRRTQRVAYDATDAAGGNGGDPFMAEQSPPGQNSGVVNPVYTPAVDPHPLFEDTTFNQSPEVREIPNPTPFGGQMSEQPYSSDPNVVEAPPQLSPIQDTKGVFTWLPGNGDHLGMFDIDVQTTVYIPPVPGMWISPGFQTHFLNGPTRTDLPEQIYNARVEVGWMKQFDPRFALQLAVAPGIYSDFDNTSSDAWRVLGKAVGFFTITPQTQALLGFAYLDRDNLPVLPIVGVIHNPSDNVRLEFVFPRPKFAYRLSDAPAQIGAPNVMQQRWVYLLGEFGGGSWAIQRANGADDVLTYSDWRLILGIESKSQGALDWLFEVGYVFNRKVEYSSGIGDYDPNSTGLIRFGLIY